MLVAREVALGDRKRKYNLFRWYEVDLNLPVDPWYQPHCTWVYRKREEGCVAADLFVHVASPTLPAKGIWVSTLLLGIDLLKLV